MADSKLSELTTASGASSSDLLYVVQGNTSKKISASSLAASILAGNLTNSSNAKLLLGPNGVAKSFGLTIDSVNDNTGFYADTSTLQVYTSSYVHIITDSMDVGYNWYFNKNGTATWPTNGYVPATSTSTGTTGQIAWDSGYVYICVAANTWKRATLNSW